MVEKGHLDTTQPWWRRADAPFWASLLQFHYLSLEQKGRVENPIVGPRHGDLVNLFTQAPTGLLSRAFVYSLQLLGWVGEVPQSLAEPEQASLWTLPLMPTPQLLKKERLETWRTGYLNPVITITTQ